MKTFAIILSLVTTSAFAETTIHTASTGNKVSHDRWRGKYLYEMPKMCFKGNIDGVMKIIYGWMKYKNDWDGNILHPDQGVYAAQYNGKEYVNKDLIEGWFGTNPERMENYKENRPDIIEEWQNFSAKDTVMIVSDLGPQGDGTELYLTEIAKCKR